LPQSGTSDNWSKHLPAVALVLREAALLQVNKVLFPTFRRGVLRDMQRQLAVLQVAFAKLQRKAKLVAQRWPNLR
jgi:hypothetical protein